MSGHRVVGRFVYRGTHAGELMGIPASGKPVEMRSIDIWRAEDGMFVEHWDELNLMEMFQQMGALPPWAAALREMRDASRRPFGIIASAAACVFAALAARPVASATAGAALALLVVWVLLYLRVSAPINRALTAAADKTPDTGQRARCNTTGTASSRPGLSCRAWQSPRCA
jgi:hypothetical protein